MKRTTLTVSFILAMLFSMMAGTQFSFSVRANPSPYSSPASPIIIIESPTNCTYNMTSLPLKVTTKSFNNYWEMETAVTTVRLISYNLDGGTSHLIGNRTASGQHSIPADYILGEYSSFVTSGVLSDLKEGLHNLTVRAEYEYICPEAGSDQTFASESAVCFRIDLVPQNVSVLMPKNNTYVSTGVPLQFFIDEPALWVGYSLDGQENVTITGNTTFPILSVGQHNLTLYASDLSGNPATSETTTFIIVDPFPTLPAVAISGTSMLVAGVIVHLRRRKRS